MIIKERFNKDKLFFTSDTHMHHQNIMYYCNRNFSDMETMDKALIANWNSVVPKDGIVIHAGDFAMTSNVQHINELVSKLNGTIYLCLGNHDYRNRYDRDVVKQIFGNRVYDVIELLVKDEEASGGEMGFFISHYPHLFWRRGRFHLHGHVHSNPLSTNSEKVPFHTMRYDIGTDNNNLFPISYNELKILFTKYSLE